MSPASVQQIPPCCTARRRRDGAPQQVHRFLLRVACELERDRPWPRRRDKREAMLAEDRLRDCASTVRRGEEDPVGCAPLVSAGRGIWGVEEVNRQHMKGKPSLRVMVYSRAQGSATSAWSFIQSAPRPNLRAVSAMHVRSCCPASGKPSAQYSDTNERWT